LAFGVGLTVSGMARPSKVAAFLDVGSGAWDPSLAFVMGGALCVTFAFFQLLERRATVAAPLLGGVLDLPSRSKAVDAQLVVGSALFGAGWGVCGMCPGPVWVILGVACSWHVALVVAAMLVGMRAWSALEAWRSARSVKANGEAAPSTVCDDATSPPQEVEATGTP